MKAKYISPSSFSCFSNPETIYEVRPSPSGDEFWEVYDEGKALGPWYKSRFELLPKQTLEQQLQTAKNKVSELEKQIEAQKPKIGQKYKHRRGSVYMIVIVGGQYALVCIEGEEYLGEDYSGLCSNVEDVFCGNKECFTLL